MILYVDETECPEYFIVTGLLVRSKEDVELAFKRFHKKVDGIKLSQKQKSILFTEFKSTLIDNDYQHIKKAMLSELVQFEYGIIYTCYIKKESRFSQKEKERSYINMISKIVASIDKQIDICFDTFNKNDFEINVIKKLLSFKHVTTARSADSQKEPGLKFADNLCSVMRLHRTCTDINEFYEIVKNSVKEV